MKKNYLCCIRLETEVLESLRKRALAEEIGLSEFIRRMLKSPSKLDRIESKIEDIHKKLILKTKYQTGGLKW